MWKYFKWILFNEYEMWINCYLGLKYRNKILFLIFIIWFNLFGRYEIEFNDIVF